MPAVRNSTIDVMKSTAAIKQYANCNRREDTICADRAIDINAARSMI